MATFKLFASTSDAPGYNVNTPNETLERSPFLMHWFLLSSKALSLSLSFSYSSFLLYKYWSSTLNDNSTEHCTIGWSE